jgi:AraC-like DNA-binding protein
MSDPLADVVSLLQPGAPFSKVVAGAGQWRIRRAEVGQTFYCVVLDGQCSVVLEGAAEAISLQAGDFVLIPSTFGFLVASEDAPPEGVESQPLRLGEGEFRLGDPGGPPNARLLVGYCVLGSPDAALLVTLLPQLVHVRGQSRLAALVQWVSDECRAQRPAREVVLARLLEVLLIEALRSSAGTAASPGLLRGLADERLAAALRCMHQSPTQAWTVVQLAKVAALSRSAFFARFSRAVGLAPMEYLLRWRMALAKNMLRPPGGRLASGISVAEVAQRVGYGSASAFSVAFTRYVGVPPAHYARAHGAEI